MAMSLPTPSPPAGEPPLPPKKVMTRSSPALTWSVLSPELVGRVGRYVDIGSDLTSLCLVAGPYVSRNISSAYLRDNDDYVRYAFTLALDSDVRRTASRVRSWMAVNTDWAKRCQPPPSFEIDISPVYSVRLAPEVAIALLFRRMNVGQHFAYAGKTMVDEGTVATLARIKVGDILVYIGDVRVDSCSSLESVREIIINKSVTSEDGTIQLEFMRDPLSYLFNDPMFAIMSGMTEILKVLVDRRFVCVNDVYRLKQSGERKKTVSLLWYSMVSQKRAASFNYLLSRHDIDICSEYQNSADIGGNDAVLHRASTSPKISIEYLQKLLQHRTADVNVVCSKGRTPLHSLCRSKKSDDARITKLRLLLGAGADPHARDSSDRTAIDNLTARIGTEENQSVKAHLHELLSILLEETQPA